MFSKLNLSHAYLQLQLEEESKEFVTIVTHKGLFRYNRLPFGVAAAAAIFMMSSVEYLGFHIPGEGIRPTQEKRQAILNACPL